jgi:hypothetical protein
MTSGVFGIASQQGIDGCPTFAQAYVGRKRWAQPNDRSRCIDLLGGCSINAIKFHRKSGAKRSRGTCCSTSVASNLNGCATSPLSSRPKRSEVEGSAVRPSALPTSPSQTSTPNRSVIPTGAQRSRGTCCSSSSVSNLNGSATLFLCHPDRSVAKWRDLQFYGPLLEMFSTERSGYSHSLSIRERKAVASTRPGKAPR